MGNLIAIYIRMLKLGWKVHSCEVLVNGCVVLHIYDPAVTAERRDYFRHVPTVFSYWRSPVVGEKATSFFLEPKDTK